MSRLAYRSTGSGLMLAGVAALYGCSSDGQAAPTSQIAVTTEIPGTNCSSGGLRLAHGTDSDGDGALSSTEVTSTEYVCNGNPSALITTDVLPVGDSHCANGGMAIHHGTDTNADGALGSSEIAADEYVCNAVVTSEAGVCVFPSEWVAATASCVATADWSSRDLSGRTLTNAYLAGVNLSGANLTGSNLSWSELRGSDLSGATLTNANLSNTSLEGANLSNAILDGADLTGVDLRGANLDGVSAANLAACPGELPGGWTCADLGAAGRTLLNPDALLDGLDLTGADLSQTDLDGVQAIHLAGCPAQLPQGWRCIDLGASAGMSLVGPGADLRGLNLSGADFSSVTNLGGAQFEDANLSGASFGADTNLQDASFLGANMSGVDFGNDADLQDVDFAGATLAGASFGTGADFSDASFAGATLTGLSARDINGCPASLPNGWDCVGNVLIGPAANLPGVDLSGADLRDVDLTSANLAGADLSDVDLSGVVISSVNFSNADLTGADLNGVTALGTVWDNTTCPNGDNSDNSGNTCL